MSQLNNVFMVSRRRYCAVPVEEVENEAVGNVAESICYEDTNIATSSFKAVNMNDNRDININKTDTHTISKSYQLTSPPLSILNTSTTTDGHATPQSTSILLSDGKEMRKSSLNNVHPVLLLGDDDYDDNVKMDDNDNDNNFLNDNKKTIFRGAKMTDRFGRDELLYKGAKATNNVSCEHKHDLMHSSFNNRNVTNKSQSLQNDRRIMRTSIEKNTRPNVSENNENSEYSNGFHKASNNTIIKLPEVLRISTEKSNNKSMNYSSQRVAEELEELPLISLVSTDKQQQHHHHSSHHSKNNNIDDKVIIDCNGSDCQKKKSSKTWSRRESNIIDHNNNSNNNVEISEQHKHSDKSEVAEKGVKMNYYEPNNIHRNKMNVSVDCCTQQTISQGNKGSGVADVENKCTEKNNRVARSSWGASFGSYMSSITSSCLDSAMSNTSSNNEQRHLSCRVSHELSQNSLNKKYKDMEKSARGESLLTSSSLPHMHHSSVNTSLQRSSQSVIRLGAIHLDRSRGSISPRSSAINLKR